VEVALVHWPAEEDRREELRRGGQPRLLLVEKGAPPIPTDGLEDWIRLPADDIDLRVRVEALLDRFGAVVSRDALARSGWPGGSPGRNALDVHVLRLRRRLSPLQLAIRTVRSRGYLLERSDAGQVVAGLNGHGSPNGSGALSR